MGKVRPADQAFWDFIQAVTFHDEGAIAEAGRRYLIALGEVRACCGLPWTLPHDRGCRYAQPWPHGHARADRLGFEPREPSDPQP